MDQFESFETKRFVQRLLGKGDVSGLMDKIQVGAGAGFRACPVGVEFGRRYGRMACHGQEPDGIQVAGVGWCSEG